jgi:glutamate/aspartate transport system permease protein
MSLDLHIFCKSTFAEEYSPHCFGDHFTFGATASDPTYLDWLLTAWGWTAAVSGLALIIALGIGILMGTLRTLPQESLLNKAITLLANSWVELFRNIPVLVQIFLWYHVIPIMIPALKSVPSFLLVSLALGFFTSARIAEQVKSGIFSLAKGQSYAALSLGMTNLSFCDTANGSANYHTPANFRMYEYCQKFFSCLCCFGFRVNSFCHANPRRNITWY